MSTSATSSRHNIAFGAGDLSRAARVNKQYLFKNAIAWRNIAAARAAADGWRRRCAAAAAATSRSERARRQRNEKGAGGVSSQRE